MGLKKKYRENVKKEKFQGTKQNSLITVEPRVTNTRLIRTPRYYDHFSLSQGKALTLSLNLTRLIRTPVNEDNPN